MSKKFVSLCALCIVCISGVYAQGILRGKVTDTSGETVIGAVVSLRSDMSKGVLTDYDGNYSIDIIATTPQTVVVTYIGYDTLTAEVVLAKSEVQIKDFVMGESATVLQSVVIVAKQERSQAYYMETVKRKSANNIDYISAETMKKIGDSNVTAAVSRVSGVSTNGSFITVRGIGDRYVLTSINGSQIPTLDPFTNNIKLDIIPSTLVDNVIISKTASPDLPGDWTGAYISVETKDYPEKFSLSVESQVGYNNNSSFREILGNPTSKTDWLGYDNGFRDRSHDQFQNYETDPTDFEVMKALGLKEYYQKLGVTSDWANLSNQETKDNYYKLGLIELGLLAKGDFNNRTAIETAKSNFVSQGFRNKAYETLNAGAVQSGLTLPNNWTTFKKRASSNLSQSFSLGNQTKLFGKNLGYIIGGRYGQTIQYDPVAVNNRTISSGFNDGLPIINESSIPEIARYSNGWSALLNLAYKYSSNHSTSILLMPNFVGTNNLREGVLYNPGADFTTIYGGSQFFEQRKQLIYQLKSEHYLPKSEIKIELNASYTNGRSEAPDFKRFKLFEFDSLTYWFDGTAFADDPLQRDFRYLNEDLLDSRISIEIPIFKKSSFTRKIKVGGAYKNLNRNYDQYEYQLGFIGEASPFAVNKDLFKFFDLDHFKLRNAEGGLLRTDNAYGNPDFAPSHVTGKTAIAAMYAMVDYNINASFRVNGGLRVENTDLNVDAVAYDLLNLPRGDIRRIYNGPLIANPGILQSLNFLPSVNFIYKIRKDEISPVNLRLNYSKTLARPSQREYSESILYDNELRRDVFGNANLELVEVDNYDLRLESYFKSGDNVSLSLFYKNFKNHIELIDLNGGFSWSNSDRSSVQGIELEGRKRINDNLDFTSNVSLVTSKSRVIGYFLMLDIETFTQIWVPTDTFTRVMYGQSPLVVNAMLSYKLEKWGINTSLAYNVQAPRLVIQGSRDLKDLSKNIPDIYEMPRHLIDFKVSKSLLKKVLVSLTIRDLLNSPIRRSYRYVDSEGKNLGYLVDFDKLRFGTNFLLSVAYKI